MMTALPITLPATFPLVGLGIVGGLFVNGYAQYKVIGARKSAGVKYPTLYLTEAETNADPEKKKYNCCQRAHQVYLENLPTVYALTLFVGVFKPETATALVLTWLFGRVFHIKGYTTGNPDARNNNLSRISYIGLLGLIGYSMYISGQAAIKYVS